MKAEKRIGERTIRALGAAVLALLTVFAAAEPAAGQTAVQAKSHRKAVKIHKINLNTATEAQLASVKGITPDLAKRIIAERSYRKVDELSKAGMDAPSINAVRPFVTVGGWGGRFRKPAYRLKPGEKVNLNAADQKVIEALPGIGRHLASVIIDHRPYAGIEDVMKVRGIKTKTFARIKNLITVR
jgi:DNA uptake protein ComE-like DNA-binding protein